MEIFQNISLKEFPIFKGEYPIFYKGILLTHNLKEKGLVLGAFFDHLKIRPKKVIFFDDKTDYQLSVSSAMKTRKIPFHGYHYLGADDLPEVQHQQQIFDEKLSRFQFDYLKTHEEWIDYQQARKLMTQPGSSRI